MRLDPDALQLLGNALQSMKFWFMETVENVMSDTGIPFLCKKASYTRRPSLICAYPGDSAHKALMTEKFPCTLTSTDAMI